MDMLQAGFGVAFLRPNELAAMSELVGGRKVRDHQMFHIKPYDTLGHYQIELFRVNGAQETIPSAIGSITDISNMVTSGKMDEPFLIERIALYWKNGSALTATANMTETIKILSSGKFTFFVNNKPVFERSPISQLGSIEAFNTMGQQGGNSAVYAYADLKLTPHSLDPMIFCEENITIKGLLQWDALETVTADSMIGVYLIGKKYEKA